MNGSLGDTIEYLLITAPTLNNQIAYIESF